MASPMNGLPPPTGAGPSAPPTSNPDAMDIDPPSIQPAQPPSQPEAGPASQPQPQPQTQAPRPSFPAPPAGLPGPPSTTTTIPTAPPTAPAAAPGPSDAQRKDLERKHVLKERKKKEREELLGKKDKSLGELLVMLDDYQPLIPDEVTDYYLQRSGFECDDPRLKRLLSLAAQKFVNDIASDAFHYAKLRTNAVTTKPGKGGKTVEKDKTKITMTMDDLTNALNEHGVNAKKPDYYF